MKMNENHRSFRLPSPFGVGYEDAFNTLSKLMESQARAVGYPPFNIRKEGDEKYVVELAVAGFGKSEMEIELKDKTLVIRGNADNKTPQDKYIHKGISSKSFERSFALADTIEVKNAELVNGILKVTLENLHQAVNTKWIPIGTPSDDKRDIPF